MFELTYIAVIIFVATFINFIATSISWQRRRTKEGQYFAWGMVGVTVWTLASGLDYAAVPISLKIFFAKWEVVGYNSALTFFALFVLSYVGHQEWLSRKWVKALFVFIPLSNILLVWTNEFHKWVWTGFERNALVDNVVIFRHGPAFVWVTATGYSLILIILTNLWLASRRGSEISRQQARYLFWSALFPVLMNFIYLDGALGMQGVDWTSVTFSVTGLLFLFTLSNTRLLDIVPIAHDKLIHGLSDGMLVLDLQHRIIDANQTAADILGVPMVNLIGRDLGSVTHLSRSFMEQPLEEEIKAELEAASEVKRYFDVLLSPLREKNIVIGRLIIFRDITRHKKNEMRLLQLSQAVEQSPASVLITDLDGCIQYANPHFSTLTGYALDEVIGKKTSILKSGFTADDVYRDMWQTIFSGRTWTGEFLNRKKNGELYWEQAVMAPVIDPSGKLINFIAVKEDITQRKQAESALRDSEARFRQLVTSAPDAVFGMDAQGKIIFANHEATRLLGYEEKELSGMDVEILIPESLRHKHVEHRAAYSAHPRTRAMGAGRELTARRKDGSVFPVDINLSSSTTEQGLLVIAHMRDVTERKQVEAALEKRFLEIQELNKNLQETQAQLVEQQRTLAALDERRRLGRNMHDSVNQSIHSLMLFSETLTALLEKDEKEKALYIAERMQQSGSQALREIRLLVYESQSPILDQDTYLISALEERLDMVERRVGVQAELIYSDDFIEHCPQDWNENLYWMITEALNNSLKYSKAKHVKVMFHCSEGWLDVEITDDGIGFASIPQRKGGFGMQTMRERAELMGGVLQVESIPEQGTRICFRATVGA